MINQLNYSNISIKCHYCTLIQLCTIKWLTPERELQVQVHTTV